MKGTFLKVVAFFLSITLLTTIGIAKVAQQRIDRPVLCLGSPDAMLNNQSADDDLWIRIADITEGGRTETDFNSKLISEWWYLNGKVKVKSIDGEQKDLGFFVIGAHQESALYQIDPEGNPYSLIIHLYALYGDGEPFPFYKDDPVPRKKLEDSIKLRTPYLYFKHDFKEDVDSERLTSSLTMSGAGLCGFCVKSVHYDAGVTMNLFFRPKVVKTTDQADYPLTFNTYERACGDIYGFINLKGKKYKIMSGEGYFDHMIPRTQGLHWTFDYHGWNWLEVTTESYQAILYATRKLKDGEYSFKHLTILDKGTGFVLAEYFDEEVMITEDNWQGGVYDQNGYEWKRPIKVTVTTKDGTVRICAKEQSMKFLDWTREICDPQGQCLWLGFVDFMGYQPDGASIQYIGKIESGNCFREYQITVPIGYPNP